MTDYLRVFGRIFAVAMLVLGVSSASSELRAQSGVHDWSGFYGGVHAGYVWGDYDYSGGAFGTGSNQTPDDGIFGVLAGYNYQMETFVLGLEGDASISYAHEDDTFGGAAPFPVRADIQDLYTLRARLGFAMDNVMVYGTAGVGLLGTKTRVPGSAYSEDHWGFVVGAGAEWAFNETWSVRGEYLYGDFETENVGGGISLNPEVHILRAAVVWQFGGLLENF